MAVFSTHLNTDARENIANVFGAKTLSGLASLSLDLELQPTGGQLLSNGSTQDDGASRNVKISGYISRPVFGEGRQAPDRQMFFVNSRPCGLPQVSRAINEVYKSYNVTQSPFIFANLILDTNAYDVNVSPDKRTILLHDQPALIESLKRALTDMFEKQEQTVPQVQSIPNKLAAFRPLTVATSTSNENRSDAAAHLLSLTQAEDEGTSSSMAATYLRKQEGSQMRTPMDLLANFVGRNHDIRATSVQPLNNNKYVILSLIHI